MSRFLTLNIGASKATLAEYALGAKGALTLNAYGSADLAGVDADAVGSLEAALAPALRSIMREKGIKPAPLVVSLGGQTVFPKFAKLPPVTDEKLEQLIRYEIEQNVPFPIDEIVSDSQILGEAADGDKTALIVAAKHDQVTQVTDAACAAGLTPVIVDAAPLAVCNAVRAANPGLAGCSVILDVGSRTTNLILVEDEKIYNRSIPVAGNVITKEISQAFGCTLEEAEQLKCERGYVSLGGVTEDEDEVADRVSKVIRTVFTRLHAEISRSINFYRSQQGGSAPARLFLTGGTTLLPQLDEFFRQSLQIEVEYLNPFAAGVAMGAKLDSSALESDALTLGESVGLALRMNDAASIRINLMPPELVERARSRQRIPFLVGGAIAALAALGLGVVAASHGADVLAGQSELVSARNDALKSMETKLKTAQKDLQAEFDRCDDFQQLLASRSTALVRVKAVADSLVKGMWLTTWEPVKNAKGDDVEAVAAEEARVTVRGWSDAMRKAEKAWRERNATKKPLTAAEIVQGALKNRAAVIVPESVQIVAQKDDGTLVEFALKMRFAPAASIQAETGRKGKKGTK